MAAAVFRRRRYLVNVPFQVRYGAYRTCFLVIYAVLLWALVYTPTHVLFAASTWGGTVDDALELYSLSQKRLGLGLIGIALLASLQGIFESFRIAGPLEKVKRTLGAMAAGDIPGRVTLRKGDEFKELAPALNAVADRLREVSRAEAVLKTVALPGLSELLAAAGRGSVGQGDVAALIRRVEAGLAPEGPAGP